MLCCFMKNWLPFGSCLPLCFIVFPVSPSSLSHLLSSPSSILLSFRPPLLSSSSLSCQRPFETYLCHWSDSGASLLPSVTYSSSLLLTCLIVLPKIFYKSNVDRKEFYRLLSRLISSPGTKLTYSIYALLLLYRLLIFLYFIFYLIIYPS